MTRTMFSRVTLLDDTENTGGKSRSDLSFDSERTGEEENMSATDDQGVGDLTRDDIVRGLETTGLKSGDIVLVHSAMRTFGYIEGGAEAVIDALLEVLGERGTLVVPTFCYIHEVEEDPIIDPVNDASEMGIISETVRLRPDAVRSTAFRHSLAAVGRRARVITEVDPTLSEFDPRHSFGVLLSLNAKILLLGVTYSSATTYHFAEYLSEVPYRYTIDLEVKVRLKDGALVSQRTIDYQPLTYTGSRGVDFNRLGKMLEERGRVKMTAIGNCIARCFYLRHMIDMALAEAEKDYNVFRTPEGQPNCFTRLDFGTIVLSPEMPDSAGRPNMYQWCVKEESKLTMPRW